jgi:hypothetical protein
MPAHLRPQGLAEPIRPESDPHSHIFRHHKTLFGLAALGRSDEKPDLKMTEGAG